MNNNVKFAPRPPAHDAELDDQQPRTAFWRTRIATVIMMAIAAWAVVIGAIVLFFIT